MIKAAWYMIAALGLIAFSACSGGGGGGGNTVPQPKAATVRISTQGSLSPGTKIGGIDLTLTLPSGVTVKAAADAKNSSKLVTSEGVVTISGVATVATTTASTLILATYTPISSTAGKVDVKIVNAEGFGAGEFVTIKCNIAAGYYPKEADFDHLALIKAVNLNGAIIDELTLTYAAEIK